MQHSLLICDLDGTLIDSRKGVVEALRHACKTTGVALVESVEGLAIGPPLDDFLRHSTGVSDSVGLQALREGFTRAYDEWAHKLSAPFPGIPELLNAMLADGVALAIATNKRLKPTKHILDALGWQNFFTAVHCVDSSAPRVRTKAQMLQDLVRELTPRAAVYFGDTPADLAAARDANLPFLFARWGYSSAFSDLPTYSAAIPADVIAVFATAARETCPR